MIETKSCINVYSGMNPWIDFCVVIGAYEDLFRVEEIVRQAYDDWWEVPDAQCEPIADYISRCLYENGVEFEIYFKNEEEE